MSAVRGQQKRGGLLSAVRRQKERWTAVVCGSSAAEEVYCCVRFVGRKRGGLLSAVRGQQKRGGLLSAVRRQKERRTVVCGSSAAGEG